MKSSQDQKHVNSVLREFNVETEEELNSKMAQDALTIPCSECDNEYEPDELYWVGGEPYCYSHYMDILESEGDLYD